MFCISTMKLNINNNTYNRFYKRSSLNNEKPTVGHYKYKESKNNYEKIRPARAISFGGSAVSLGEKFVKSAPINKVVDLVNDNETAFNAIYALFLAGIIKPMLVLNSKGAEEKDKQIIATKNFLQAFIGSFLSFTIGGKLINKAVGVIENNMKLLKIGENRKLQIKGQEEVKSLAEELLIKENNGFSHKYKHVRAQNYGVINSLFKALTTKNHYTPDEAEIAQKATSLIKNCKEHKHIFEKNPIFINKILSGTEGKKGTTLYEAYRVFWKNSTEWITAIGKAKISSLLLPSVLAFLFNKKMLEKHSTLTNSKSYKNDKQNFKPFSNKNADKVSFKGGSEKIINNFAKGIEHISMTRPGERCVELLSNTKKPSPRMGDITSFLLTGYWLYNTTKSKKIDPDQKLGLNIQSALVTIVSSFFALGIDWACDKPLEIAKNNFKNVLTNNITDIKDMLSSVEDTHAIKELIAEKCSNLAGCREIADKLSSINFKDSKQLSNTITKLSNSYGKKLSKLKSLTIFALVVRLLVPVLMVPVAGKIKNLYKKQKAKKVENNTNKA